MKQANEKPLKGQLIVLNFGIIDGVQTYRVNGLYEDLQTIINDFKTSGGAFKCEPAILRAYPHSLFTVLLEIKIEAVEGLTHDNENKHAYEPSIKKEVY